MSKKYVPTFLRNSEQDKELVNTSLPAKEVTPLCPATLASLTKDTATVEEAPSVGSFRSLRASRSVAPAPVSITPKLSSDDFPSLSIATPSKPQATAWGKSFASLASKWAEEQKEKEVTDRSEASLRRVREEENRRKKQELESGMRALGALSVSYHPVATASNARFQTEEDIQREKERQRLAAELLAEDAKYTRMVYDEDAPNAAEDWEWRRRSKHEF